MGVVLTRTAHAGDQLRPRTPVLHRDERCLTVIDRAVTPFVELEYSIPYEDTCALIHPAPTHQFFAFCRTPTFGRSLPPWITWDEIEAAHALGLPLPPVTHEDALNENIDWQDCVWPITARPERRPITCEAALEGVVWDVREMPLGMVFVAGYTFHPPSNLWSPRHGAFKIEDSTDPVGAPPAIAFAHRTTYLYSDETFDLELCVDALPGSRLALAYATWAEPDRWTTIASDLLVEDSAFHFPWDPPDRVGGQNVTLEVTITDPLERAVRVTAQEPILVLAVPAPAPVDGAANEPPWLDVCRESTAEPPATSCPSGPKIPDPAEQDSEEAEDRGTANGCSVSPTRFAPPGGFAAFLGLVVLAYRGSPRLSSVSIQRATKAAAASSTTDENTGGMRPRSAAVIRPQSELEA